MTIEGAVNSEVFRLYVREVLLPTLTPRDVLVMDNLSAHKDGQARTSPFQIILRYNAAYPLVVDRNFADNPAIQRIPLDDGDGFTAIPKRGQGIHQPVDDDRFSSVLRWAASNDLYATIYLYPDSHGVFADLRESLARAKLSYGLEFIPPGRELNFASEGESPPEL